MLLLPLIHMRCTTCFSQYCVFTGPKVDEFFTLSIGGMVTVLNTSGQPIHPGDLVEWCFFSEKGTHEKKRARAGPRRFGITIASVSSPKVIGRALSFAKAGEQLDMLLKQ